MTPKKRTVRTRIEPGRELEVDQAEHTLGVLIPDGDVPVRVASERVDGGPGTGLAVRAEASAPRGAALPTHNIQTVFRPDLTITVSDDEYQQLLAEGLVYSGNPQAPAADAYDLLFASKVSGGTATPAALRAAYVALPTGGSDGQVLVKSGSSVVWGAGGGGGTTVTAGTDADGVPTLTVG